MPDILSKTWIQFLRQRAQIGGFSGSCAKLVMQIGGEIPSVSRNRLDEMLRMKKINEDQFQVYKDAIDVMSEERLRSKSGFASSIKPDAWVKVNGGYMKKTFIDGFYEGYENSGALNDNN